MSFCQSYSLPAFPLSEVVLYRFVASLVRDNLSYSTVRLYLSAVRHRQLMDGGEDPALGSLHILHYVLRGCHRSLPSSIRPQRLPISPNILRLLYRQWSNKAQDYDIVCLWAACCIAFFAFLRSGEFTCDSWAAYNDSVLSLQDVSVDSHSCPSMVHLMLRRSKTDIFGSGITIHLGKTGDILRPVSSLLSYLVCRPRSPGPLFLLRSGHPLSRVYLVHAVRQALSCTGLDVSRFNGHSFRIGAATAAAEAGLSDATIQQLGRWRSSAFLRYLRPPVQAIAARSRHLIPMSHARSSIVDH